MPHTEGMNPTEPGIKPWSAPAGLIACGWVFTAAAAVWWSFTSTSADQLFVAVVTIALLVTCLAGTVLRPRLRADSEGVAVRGLGGTHRWPWPDVGVRVRTTRHLGLTAPALELEVPEDATSSGLVVLTRLDLGADPRDVAEEIEALRPQPSP
jgi:hypothetical protein